ncbi:MAG TPA: hypothetical protein VM577_08185 [Anaerovoracaceae bacterium]|nr:hypothetical protein [Anaerovoracaceae bacterium]
MLKGKKERRILPYAAFVIRVSFALFAMVIAMLFFLEMIKAATNRYTFALCFLVPVFAVVLVGGDIYMRYKLDIKPLREAKKERKKNYV